MARIMITIPDTLLVEIDEAAQSEHCTRSELLREATRQYLRQVAINARRQSSSSEPVGIIERLRIQAQERARSTTDSTALIRSFRGEITTPQTNFAEV